MGTEETRGVEEEKEEWRGSKEVDEELEVKQRERRRSASVVRPMRRALGGLSGAQRAKARGRETQGRRGRQAMEGEMSGPLGVVGELFVSLLRESLP